MKHTLSLVTILALLLVLLSACSPAAAQLDGTDWKLTELNGTPIPATISITLAFKDGQAGGTSACNSYGAKYTQSGSKLAFDQTVSTLMYCENVMTYETDYLAALDKIQTFKLENDRLSLLDDSGTTVLLFAKP